MARTPSAATDTTNADDHEMAARIVVEDHWAVAALAISDRQRARALVKRAWRKGAPRLRDAWPPRDTELLTRVANAYELAALEQVDLVGDAPGANSAHGFVALRGASDVAFSFTRTRPLPPPWDPAHLPHVLRALALAALGGDSIALRQWIEAARVARRDFGVHDERESAASDALPHKFLARWDSRLRDTLVEIWLDAADVVLAGLTDEAAVDGVARAFDALGKLREQRAAEEAELLFTLSADIVPRMRAHLQVLYALADATAHAVVWARRGDVRQGVEPARDAIAAARLLTAGDRTLDAALRWLATALALPTLVVAHDETAASAVDADGHRAPKRAAGRTGRNLRR